METRIPAGVQLPPFIDVAAALKLMGAQALKSPYKQKWSEENPTLGFCYVVSETMYHYATNEKSTPKVLSFDDGTTHWWLELPNGEIIDYTAEQFSFPIDYSAGVRCPFFKGGTQTERGHISKRGQKLAELLNLV